MPTPQCRNNTISALLLAGLLTACGGGSDSGSAVLNSPASGSAESIALQQEPGAPTVSSSGNTALDGFNWTNFRRKQAGIPELIHSSVVDIAAQGHSEYQKLNNTITHVQSAGKPGFTGATLLDRLNAAGYAFGTSSYAYGEVIAAASESSGFYLAEELVAAIYHRFVMFEPIFKESGTGAATIAGGYTYFTNNFTTNNGFGPGIGSGQIALYPYAGQSHVPTVFFSDQEEPDPVPNQNQVGYPISVHANLTSTLKVDRFTVRPRGGATMSVRLLTAATDAQTAISGKAASAIIPLAVLDAGTTYDVSFSGQVDDVQIDKNWSFTTQ